MKGLLLKEGYQAFAYGKSIFFAAVVMFAASAVILMQGGEQGMFLIYACFLMGIFPMTQLAYDESFGWTEYSYTLPVGREQLVGVKYLTGLVFMAFGALLSALVLLFFGKTLGQGYAMFLMTEAICAPMISNTVLLPMSYRLGYKKARYLYLGFVAFFAVVLNARVFAPDSMGDALTGMHPTEDALTGTPVLLLLGSVAVCGLLYLASWRLSVAWYGKARD